MDEETLNIFLDPVDLVLKSELDLDSVRNSPVLKTLVDIEGKRAFAIGLMGSIQGDLIFYAENEVVKKFESTYRRVNEEDDPDLTSDDIFCEVLNMFVGRALMNLSSTQGIECRMTSPRVLLPSSFEVKDRRYVAIFSASFETEIGLLNYDIAIRSSGLGGSNAFKGATS